jgi:hypothetical protein
MPQCKQMGAENRLNLTANDARSRSQSSFRMYFAKPKCIFCGTQYGRLQSARVHNLLQHRLKSVPMTLSTPAETSMI